MTVQGLQESEDLFRCPYLRFHLASVVLTLQQLLDISPEVFPELVLIEMGLRLVQKQQSRTRSTIIAILNFAKKMP